MHYLDFKVWTTLDVIKMYRIILSPTRPITYLESIVDFYKHIGNSIYINDNLISWAFIQETAKSFPKHDDRQ